MKSETLGNIADIIAGQSPPSSAYNKIGEGLPFFQGKTDYGTKYPIIRTWTNETTKISIPSDILISVRAPVGPVNINNVESCIGRGLSAIRVKKNIYNEYVYYYLKINERLISKLGVGSTFTAITQKDLATISVPIPEYNDQIRIATIISKLEALISQRKDSIDWAEKFLKSTFIKMFGNPVNNEKGWKKNKIENYTSCIVPGRDKPKSFSGNIPWFTTEDLIDKGFVVKSKKALGLSDKEIAEVRAKIIPAGSIIMTCVGDLGVLSINEEPCVVNQQLHTFQCNSSMNNIFLMYNLSFLKNFMFKMASTTTVPYMNKTTCNSIPVLSPPLSLQTDFAKIFIKIHSIKKQYQDSLKELENLFGAICQKAFKGELDLSRLRVMYEEEYSATDNDRTEPKPIDFDRVSIEIKPKSIENRKETPKIVGKEIKQPKSKILWEKVSSKQIAEWIKDQYTGKHFSSEMLTNFLINEHVTFPDYYSSEDLKKKPHLNGAEDLKSFVFSALSNKNPFIKFEQHFYDAEKENFILNVTNEDYELIQSREPQDRSGIYFSIKNQ